MSTPNPFALEQQSQLETMPLWNPETAQPKWYDGLGASEDTAYLGPFYRVLEAAGNGAAKGEAMLAGVWHAEDALGARYLGNVPGVGAYFREHEKGTEEMLQDARDRVRATTPDPATTGTAAQMIHSVVSGAYRATVGSLAGGPLGGAGALGGSEATSRFQELKEQGVDTGTATASAGLAGITSGAGALLPGGFGSGLISRVLTGAGTNIGMGLADRYADHKILEAGGYQEMADQQRVWDGTQVAADAILGAAFGGLAHVHATQESRAEQAHKALLNALPAWGQAAGATDAARAAEVALRDRAAAPGVPVDPASAAAHQAALEKAQTDLLTGERVNVADTGVHDAQFLSRPSSGAGEEIVAHALREAGVLDEEQNLKDLEAALGRRMRGEPEPESVTSQTPPEEHGYTVGEEELTDEQRQAFERLAHPQDQELPGAVEGGGRQGEPGLENDGGRGGVGATGEPTRVYRGGRGGPLTPEHFSPETLGRATGHPSSGLGVFFTGDASDAARYGTVTEHDLTLQNPKRIPIEDLPGFDTLQDATAFREQLRAQGHDGIVIDSSHLGGPKHYVAFEPNGVKALAPDRTTQPLAERPEMRIPDDNGNLEPARDAVIQADRAATEGEQETPKAITAAIDCFLRKGG